MKMQRAGKSGLKVETATAATESVVGGRGGKEMKKLLACGKSLLRGRESNLQMTFGLFVTIVVPV